MCYLDQALSVSCCFVVRGDVTRIPQIIALQILELSKGQTIALIENSNFELCLKLKLFVLVIFGDHVPNKVDSCCMQC